MEGRLKEPDRNDARARRIPRSGLSQDCQRATSMVQALPVGTPICLLVDIYGLII
jgi:hypothetical protein